MENFDEKVDRYFVVGRAALKKAEEAPVLNEEKCNIVLDMARRYISDAQHFFDNGDKVLAFAALNYAHGWLDCGAMMKYFDVNDNVLFTVD